MTEKAVINFELLRETCDLNLFWIEGYGGGSFLPFRDETNKLETFSGGRYLPDTIKGVDLGREEDDLILDCNYAYNPSCAYHHRWVCPFAPTQNNLQLRVTAGERRFRS